MASKAGMTVAVRTDVKRSRLHSVGKSAADWVPVVAEGQLRLEDISAAIRTAAERLQDSEPESRSRNGGLDVRS
jgi:hypothetical protein